ncbi:MAG: HU family DNA-binding protein [Methylotenera sp.]|jgi:DNA-binding protein HU-beta|uniref:HU family DNA-binding protein n=1 Tax=Methylotenera mobilis TaxID=359408 RepID=A0A351RBM3_9PROT|nr:MULTISPECIES: HU family DNA-binding protein [Methylotenera]MDP3211715.1 HU family DNA-binding protein [Methylotenera sp.]MDP3776175.1 HU family DNA-binding protein [Methylotenera sp.]PPC97477.1 MAG: HU family DNA-binding protein [Methylotenera sp.]HBA09444.1 HU family DNA-binding protein [Methylotenera mobilis]
MNKSELVAKVAAEAGVTQADANRVLDAIISTVGDTLKAGDNVALVGFGTFQVTKKAARTGRNPSTGAAIEIAARNAPVFKAGKTLKDKVN